MTTTTEALKKIEKKIVKGVEGEWTDEECLILFSKFLTRVGINTELLPIDEEDDVILTHEVVHVICGDKVLSSSTRQLEWPLMPVPLPEDIDKRVIN